MHFFEFVRHHAVNLLNGPADRGVRHATTDRRPRVRHAERRSQLVEVLVNAQQLGALSAMLSARVAQTCSQDPCANAVNSLSASSRVVMY